MLIRYQHNEDMYKQFSLYVLENLPIYQHYHRKQRYINTLFLLIIFVIWESWAAAIGISLAFYLLAPYLLKNALNHQVNILVDSWPPDESGGLRELSLGPESLVETGSRGRQELLYSQIKNLEVDGQLIYLFYRVEEAVIVPLSALGKAAEVSAFLNFLAAKNPGLARSALPRPAPKRPGHRQGSFGCGQAAVIVGFFALFALVGFVGTMGYYFAQGFWRADLSLRHQNSDELFSGLTLVESGPELAAAAAKGNGQRIRYYTTVEALPGEKRCLIDFYFDEGRKKELSSEQLAAFSFMRSEYPRLKPDLMLALLNDYRKMREVLANAQAPGQLNNFLFPNIKTVQELEKHLGPPRWVLHRELKDGLAYVSVNFLASWLPDESYGALYLGDEMIYAGYEPEFNLPEGTEPEKKPEGRGGRPQNDLRPSVSAVPRPWAAHEAGKAGG